ncbi:MAG: hypothetical protein AAAB35_20805 [Phyllobacterium sp.]|uniref:hypothetical protein n=1 Tax=Phyllobacterium sp. TaxID=1871046 RepID=UPI0030F1F6B5
MTLDWIPRLKGHAELLKRLIDEIPQALDRPGLTIEQAERLYAVIQKGTRDFDEVLQLMDSTDADQSFRSPADNLKRAWMTLEDAAGGRIQSLLKTRGSSRASADRTMTVP